MYKRRCFKFFLALKIDDEAPKTVTNNPTIGNKGTETKPFCYCCHFDGYKRSLKYRGHHMHHYLMSKSDTIPTSLIKRRTCQHQSLSALIQEGVQRQKDEIDRETHPGRREKQEKRVRRKQTSKLCFLNVVKGLEKKQDKIQAPAAQC